MDKGETNRFAREERTIQIMINLYCQAHHKPNGNLCPECQTLTDYAQDRLQHCPFAPNKPTCANCPVHCYKPEMRERIRQIMRYAGPRMVFRHPILSIMHLLDGRIQARRKTTR